MIAILLGTRVIPWPRCARCSGSSWRSAAATRPRPPRACPAGAGGACPTGQVCQPELGRCVHGATPIADAALDVVVDVPPLGIDASSTELVDDFSRPDDAALGNGWIEKNPSVFSIANGEVVRIETPTRSYRDNMVYRPAAEDLLDVEASVQFRVLQSPPRYPQIFVRGRSATIAEPDSYEGYLLYVDGSTTDEVVLGHQLGTTFVTTLSRFTLASPLTPGEVYRLTLRSRGTSPVTLAATVEHLAGTTWAELGSTTTTDASATRTTAAGTVGFAGDEIAAYVFDDFRRRAL